MSAAVVETFKQQEVVPDVVDVAPPNTATVVYSSSCEAQLGNVLTPTQVQDPPMKVTWPTEEGAFYTLLMTDPDAKSRKEPIWREWRHWLVMNIPGNDIASGEECAAYIGAGPPKGTDLHRYIFLVFQQPGRVTYSDAKLGLSGESRGGTKARELAAKYNLGHPVAGNFFLAEWDDYVPKLYEKLSGK